ncbi:pectinesterase inhibitor-like [Cucurbita moschata]|uniref:Pectinesterase inhibitor-like n=1 Tax=Cucurbita moschata TaxID=3662 RepID=A0A6J1GBV0_CUCMO|nr:pectinesterase inhibitor-like [Cucurbita moschata]
MLKLRANSDWPWYLHVSPLQVESCLEAFPTTHGAREDLKGLATFTLNLAHDKVAQTRALALSLASKAADPKLKERYATCVEQYDDAADDIEDGKNDLGEGDYNGVNIKASAAMTEAGDCLDSFTQPPKDPSALSGNGKTVEDICSIILVIANLLLGRD